MINFNAVTGVIKRHTEWRAFLTNMEDSSVTYVNDGHPGAEIVFAEWDLIHPDEGLGALIRLDVKNEPVFQVNLEDARGDAELEERVEQFFQDLPNYLS